jgi:DNA-binding XRE family transcriptional regulator
VSLYEKYLHQLKPLITREDETECKTFYRTLPVETLWDLLQELEARRNKADRSQHYLMDFQIGWMRSVLEESGSAVLPSARTESVSTASEDARTPTPIFSTEVPPKDSVQRVPVKSYRTPLGENIDRFREECGWSVDELAEAAGIDRRLILRHVNEGKNPIPSTCKKYADAFSKRLGRPITVAELKAPRP